MNDIECLEIVQSREETRDSTVCTCVFVPRRDNFLWLHGIFALVYFIITSLCMAHHSIRLEYREDERVRPPSVPTV